jgi:hypothetical protein
LYSMTRGWASFIGFAPVEKHQLLCAVLIDEPLHGEMGGTAAAPAFAKIMGQIISHPQLQYAERMLCGSGPATGAGSDADSGICVPQVCVPQLCGMPVLRALSLLAGEHIPYEVIGTGEKIDNQEPGAGSTLNTGARMALYTSQAAPSAARGVFMPDCRGKELRDAVNDVNLRGLVPYAVGAGFVTRQCPPYGNIIRHAETCTLFCSFSLAQKKI